MRAALKMEKATKNTVRFEEILESEFDVPVIGSIYIPKTTLAQIGWKEDEILEVEVTVEGKED